MDQDGPRRRGKVIGIAMATASFKAYYPIDHDGGGNIDSKESNKIY
jgi:hypothetical protein